MARNPGEPCFVVPGMTRTRGLLTAAAIPVLLLGACAQPGAAGGPGASGPASSGAAGPVTESASLPASGDAVVLRVEQRGGFVPPQWLASRLPSVSVYADGRVISDGPVPAIAPGPALPNLLQARITADQVKALVGEAAAAGVGTDKDFGQPGVADVPSTRVTAVTGYGTQSVEVVGLDMRTLDEDVPAGASPAPNPAGLTAEQKTARKTLRAFVDKLTGLGTDTAEPYRPSEVAALAQPYTAPGDGLTSPEVRWPGPALPGDYLNKQVGLRCVAVTGARKDAVWAAAQKATQITPWVSGGRKWSVTFRPLLPDEAGCESLRNAG